MGTKGYPSKVKKTKMRLESQRLADTERQRLRVTDTARQEETHPEEQGERQGLAEHKEAAGGFGQRKQGSFLALPGSWAELQKPTRSSAELVPLPGD